MCVCVCVCVGDKVQTKKRKKKKIMIKYGKAERRCRHRPISTCHSRLFQSNLTVDMLFVFVLEKKKKKRWHVPWCLAILFSNTVSRGGFLFTTLLRYPPTSIVRFSLNQRQCMEMWTWLMFLICINGKKLQLFHQLMLTLVNSFTAS